MYFVWFLCLVVVLLLFGFMFGGFVDIVVGFVCIVCFVVRCFSLDVCWFCLFVCWFVGVLGLDYSEFGLLVAGVICCYLLLWLLCLLCYFGLSLFCMVLWCSWLCDYSCLLVGGVTWRVIVGVGFGLLVRIWFIGLFWFCFGVVYLIVIVVL